MMIKLRSMIEAKMITDQRCFIDPSESNQFEAISKIGFWFKIAAGLSFPAVRDFPPDHIRFVGRKPQAYCCMSRI